MKKRGFLLAFPRYTETFKQSLFSFSFDAGGMLAGTLVAWHLGVFSSAVWVLTVYPGILSVRGLIGGLFSGRLSTGLHIGTVRTGFLKNTKNFLLLWHTVIMLTLLSSVLLGTTITLVGVFLWGASIIDLVAILVVVTATMSLSLVFISPITVAVATLSFKRGLDPDILVYPVMSTVADIIVTACYILVVAAFFLHSPLGYFFISFLNFALLSAASYVLFKSFKENGFVQTIKESILTLISVTIIVNITGIFLTKISQMIGTARPEIYIVYPALIDTIGDVGSVVGSMATTKLALGTLKSSFVSIKHHVGEIGGAWTASLVMFTVFSIISILSREAPLMPDVAARFMAILYITNLISILFMIGIVHAVAIQTFKNGWDPDNFVIPIESSLADTLTTLFLFVAVNIIG